MRSSRVILNGLLAGAFIALAACSGSGAGGGGGEPGPGGSGIPIQVTNDIVPPVTITVWIVPETGSRRRLGSVPPNGRETFRFTPGVAGIEHTLVAEASGEQDRTTIPFLLTGVTSVQWNASLTVVRTTR